MKQNEKKTFLQKESRTKKTTDISMKQRIPYFAVFA